MKMLTLSILVLCTFAASNYAKADGKIICDIWVDRYQDIEYMIPDGFYVDIDRSAIKVARIAESPWNTHGIEFYKIDRIVPAHYLKLRASQVDGRGYTTVLEVKFVPSGGEGYARIGDFFEGSFGKFFGFAINNCRDI